MTARLRDSVVVGGQLVSVYTAHHTHSRRSHAGQWAWRPSCVAQHDYTPVVPFVHANLHDGLEVEVFRRVECGNESRPFPSHVDKETLEGLLV